MPGLVPASTQALLVSLVSWCSWTWSPCAQYQCHMWTASVLLQAISPDLGLAPAKRFFEHEFYSSDAQQGHQTPKPEVTPASRLCMRGPIPDMLPSPTSSWWACPLRGGIAAKCSTQCSPSVAHQVGQGSLLLGSLAVSLFWSSPGRQSLKSAPVFRGGSGLKAGHGTSCLPALPTRTSRSSLACCPASTACTHHAHSW